MFGEGGVCVWCRVAKHSRVHVQEVFDSCTSMVPSSQLLQILRAKAAIIILHVAVLNRNQILIVVYFECITELTHL